MMKNYGCILKNCIKIPNFSGKWQGEVKSELKKGKSEIYVNIKQIWSEIIIGVK